ncbi:MAG: RNA-guided endonuclease InsQ/TnpB family protein [Rubrobacteraceae bacterium]
MRKAYKYRLFTNRSQEQALDAALEQHRRLYNLALRERRDVYEAEERSVSYGEQSGRFKESRQALPGLATLNFSSAQATLRRLDKAFKAFFRRCKSGDAPGYPRYKPEGRFRTIEFPSHGDGCKLKDNGRLYIQNVGHIKVKQHRPVEGTIKTVSLKRSCGKWYVIFSCDLGDAPEADRSGPEVGIDLGLKSFLVTSDGASVEPPRYYRKAQKKLRQAQRSLSRKKKGSTRRGKARQLVAKLHEKVGNQRRDFQHKEARKLVDSHGLIAHEALNIKGIARTRLAKSTLDAGWAQFLNILQSKAEEAGVAVVAVNPTNTTQACSSCGAMPEVKKTLSDRVHSCPCGYTADRDVNAALNILNLGRGLRLRDGTYRSTESVSREAVCFS